MGKVKLLPLSFLALTASVSNTLATASNSGRLEIGRTVSESLHLHGKEIPIPGGSHLVVESGLAQLVQPPGVQQVNPDNYGPVRRLVLAGFEKTRIVSVVEIVTNTLPNGDGWGIATDCTRKDIYANIIRHKSGWDVSCMWLKPVVVDTEELTQTDQTLKSLANERGLSVPTFMVEIGYRIANRQDFIDVRYRFPAVVTGTMVMAADATPWQPDNIENHEVELEWVKKLAEWAGAAYPTVDTGLRTKIDSSEVLPAPFTVKLDRPSDRDQRLAKLAEFFDSGILDSSEYERQKVIIEAEIEPQLETTWTHETVAGYKAVTYRIAVTAINTGIDYFFIGTPFAAGVLVILQVVINSTKFFFHEVMWQQFMGVGPLGREEPYVMDFVVAEATTP